MTFLNHKRISKRGMKLFTTDKELTIVHKLSRGEATAIDLLYAEYAPFLTAVCARYIPQNDDMKDVLQEAFIKMVNKRDTFTYRGKGSLKAGATRIVIKQAKEDVPTTDRDLPETVDEEPEVNTLSTDEITAMIRQLPTGYRTVFNLYVIEGMSHQQIAELLNIKPDTSASQLHKAKVMLAHMIKSHQRQEEKTVWRIG